ncbi:L,D-transpeptidase family protein [Litorimonas sp.]|uniref:L,D-transpeptidase family protein n=1 Tax=Litorimonas sp. TaxID=1892381 RepID=UPI003A8C807A
MSLTNNKNYKSKLMAGGFTATLALSFIASATLSSAAPSIGPVKAGAPVTTPTYAAPSLALSYGPLDVISNLLGQSDKVDFSKELRAQIEDETFSEILKEKVSIGAIDAARHAYAQSIYEPLWKMSAAEKLYDIPEIFESHGLDVSLENKDLQALIEQRFNAKNPEERASAEIALTALWLKLTSQISGGLSDEGEGVKSLKDSPVRSELVTALRDAAQNDPIEEIENFTSTAPQYRNLRKALENYKKDVALSSWLSIPTDGEMIEPGDKDDRIPALRERLRAEGYLPYRDYFSLFPNVDKAEEDILYDEDLQEAVKAYQAANTMAVDGVVGPATLEAMNESPDSKIEKIKEALNYWRHLDAFNQQSGDRYIWVNIPSFMAEGWNDGKKEIAMKTVVGKPRTPTPDFSDNVEYIVANPKWFLPVGLFKRQKLHKLRADPGYAAAHKYNIYDRATGQELSAYSVDWNEPGIASKIQMVQTPGPHNALGELKIIFPNQHSVYLHSTPDTHLLDRDVRAFSSGCIRLDDPIGMANWITDHDSGVDTKEFNDTLQSRQRKHFNVDEQIPVHITYVGVTATEDGVPSFHRDIYNKLADPSFVEDEYPRYDGGAVVEFDNNEDNVKQTAAAQKSVSALP